jgi:ribonuclease BN (tRNA processing enzyme)
MALPVALPDIDTDTMQVSAAPMERVSLTNDGDLSLYFIGAGAAFAKTLNQNNLIIVKGDDHLLIDCGTKCSQALHKLNFAIADVENFLITHSHADHIGGLEEVQLYRRYVSQTKPTMVINEEYQKILWEQSLRGGSEMSESHPLAFGDLWNTIRPTMVSDAPRETWAADIGGIHVEMPRTMHFPDDAPGWQEAHWSCGVIIDDRVLYTSDTRFDRDLLESFDDRYNFETIFHDCQLFTGGVHCSLNELATLPDHLKAKIILMHYGDNWPDFYQEGLDMGFRGWAQQGHTYSYPARQRAIS